jgi:hypothetical protein
VFFVTTDVELGSQVWRVPYTPDIDSPPSTPTYNDSLRTSELNEKARLVANVLDRDADPVTIIAAAAPAHGTLQAGASAPGVVDVLYTPAKDYVGTDSFSLKGVQDGYSTSAGPTVTVHVGTNVPAKLTALNPPMTKAGVGQTTLELVGKYFVTGATVRINGTARPVTSFSNSRIQVQLSPADVATVAFITISAANPDPFRTDAVSAVFAVDSAGAGSVSASGFGQVTAGQPATYSISFSGATNSDSHVACNNMPLGVSCSYNPATQGLTLATSATTPPGDYSVLVTFSAERPKLAKAHTNQFLWLALFLSPLPLLLSSSWTRRKRSYFACMGLLIGIAILVSCGGRVVKPPVPTETVQLSAAIPLSVR